MLTGATRSRASPTVAARRPRPGPVRTAPGHAQPAGHAQASGRRRSRLLVAILAILVLAVAIVAGVILTAPSPAKVMLRNVVYSDVQHTAAALQKLVSENTQ